VDAITFDFKSSAMDSDRFLAELAASATEAREEAKVAAKTKQEEIELRASLASLIDNQQSNNNNNTNGSGSLISSPSLASSSSSGQFSFQQPNPSFGGGAAVNGYMGGVDGMSIANRGMMGAGGVGFNYGEDMTSDHIAPELQAALAEAEAAAAATGPKGDMLLPPLKDIIILFFMLIHDIVVTNLLPDEPKLEGRRRLSSAHSNEGDMLRNSLGGNSFSGSGGVCSIFSDFWKLSGGGIVLAKESTRVWLNRHVLSKESWRWSCWLVVLAHSLLLVMSTWPFSATSEVIQWIILIIFMIQEVLVCVCVFE
jgi:hypothetical protein